MISEFGTQFVVCLFKNNKNREVTTITEYHFTFCKLQYFVLLYDAN